MSVPSGLFRWNSRVDRDELVEVLGARLVLRVAAGPQRVEVADLLQRRR